MHPAKSVIAFTTSSGAGYGLLVWLALAASQYGLQAEMLFGLVSFAIGFGLIIFGLLASTFHLGHPERAWRAFSQWRSSWLSREGVMAVFTFLPAGAFAIYWIFMGENTGFAGQIGLVAAVASLLTVYCTAMIYASLKAIPAWHMNLTPITYLVFSLATGGMLFVLLARVWGYDVADEVAEQTRVLFGLAIILKVAHWGIMKTKQPVSTAETATGLGATGKVSLLESPHSSDNYLLKEMGFKIARKHADKLRFISNISLLLTALLLTFGATSITAAITATATMFVGVVSERWLFFAEAKHTVTLYYGESQV
jgi:DMSO reductase anchor subunit